MILIEHGFSVKGKRQTEDQTACIALAIHAYNIGKNAKDSAWSARALAEQIWRASGLLELGSDQKSIIVKDSSIRLVIVEDDEVMPAVRAWLAYYETQAAKGLDPLADTEGEE